MTITVVQAKLASMIAIGVGSFVVGIAPVCFVSRVRELQQRLLLSCTLCFGGGVLLATCILHMLPESRELMPNYAELVFACGFLLLYLVDETIHYVWGSAIDHNPEAVEYRCPGNKVDHCRTHSHQTNYSAPTQSVRDIYSPEVNSKSIYQTNIYGNGASNSWKNSTYGALQYPATAPASCFHEEETLLCHGNHSEPCPNSNTSLVGLLLALTVHSLLEGQAIGLQKTTSEVLLLVGAVASHKFVVGFCLGLELAGASSSVFRLVLAIFTFSAGSAVGIGTGMLMLRMKHEWLTVCLPILQGLAGGSLLFVTVSEILPRERARWHKSSRRSAGIVQFFSVVLGFVIIYVINNYVGG
ncbi:zinc/iron regulated transporter-related protein 88E [Megalopta genalis]|uniref:zinc/iron regulated transporter-related protein 88E n=1 Tax=Megalopta genalis TaxID=115081 RepID=UPI0014432307|nr:zinc transporter ZIP1-like isoform X1 [Megalopta genalis]XP_033322965.1 zinc transporter ZIP1-like isoform X1 [Megalopta genalis]XP_033322972.1 zinc transporter ZIP1-like isoform X2 [Megalopta genalis]